MTADGTAGQATAEAPPQVVVPKGIAILGSHPQTKALAPFDDDWLIYACSPDNTKFGFSESANSLPRVDAWFEVHVPVFDRTRPYPYLASLMHAAPVVFMRDQVAMNMKIGDKLLFPNAVAYPEEMVKKIFGPYCFSSSIAFLLAKAIIDACDMGIPAVGIWGVMQSTKEEYAYQKPGVQQMIWEAHKAGLRIDLPAAASHLFLPPVEMF